MNCYFDGSVGGQSNEWLTLGGVAAPDAIWASFHTQWEAMLRDRDPIAPYVHMTDLITGNGSFKSGAGWDENKVDRFVHDISVLLNSIDKSKICGFACSVDVHAHKRLIAEGYDVTDAAVICAEVGVGNLFKWFDRTQQLEMAYLFYDQNEPFIRSIRRNWLKFNNPNKLVTDELFWGRIANVQPVRMQDTPGVQAADVLAWAFTRRLRNAPGDRWSTLADLLLGNRQHVGILTNTQIDPITEGIMRTRYPKKPH
jgi:hypothetical protein